MFLIDTNVISELGKTRCGRADEKVVRWASSIDYESMFVSAITIYELEYGALLLDRRDPRQAEPLRRWLDESIVKTFAGRVLAVDSTVARQSAALSVPDPLPFRDALIAATAIVHGMTVVTRNVKDFAASGVPILNPWDA